MSDVFGKTKVGMKPLYVGPELTGARMAGEARRKEK
jgi:hypothetical protein